MKMMKCGHSSNGLRKLDSGDVPCCVICSCIDVVETPDFTGRIARCFYYGKETRRNECSKCGKVCNCEQPSSENLAFFEYKPNEAYDEFYCGCHSWD